MLGFTRRKPVIDFDDVHAYVNDLQRITLLRDKALTDKERKEWDDALTVMRKVLVRINTPRE